MNIQLKTLTMKTKITLLIVTICFVSTSCIKDFYSHPDDKNGILTENNYYYGDDFKSEFLMLQIEELDAEIKELTAIIGAGQGDNTTAEKLELAKQKKDDAEKQTIEIALYRDQVYRRRPPLPGPCPKDENCDIGGIQYIVVPPGLDFYELTILDANGGLVGRTDGSPQTLDNVGNLLEYLVFLVDEPDYQGDIQIQVKEISNGTELQFILDSQTGQ